MSNFSFLQSMFKESKAHLIIIMFSQRIYHTSEKLYGIDVTLFITDLVKLYSINLIGITFK